MATLTPVALDPAAANSAVQAANSALQASNSAAAALISENNTAALFVDSGWITLPLLNGFTALGAPYDVPAYRRIGDVVYVRGYAAANVTLVAVLPIGYRPTGTIRIPTIASTGTSGHAVVEASGLINLMNGNINGQSMVFSFII